MGAHPILFCSHVVEWGGAETVLADLLAGIDRSRFAPHLACPGPGPLADRARELKVPVHTVPLGGSSAWQKLRSLPRAARALRKLSTAVGAKLLYANTMIAGYAAVLASRRTLPCLWHLHIVTHSRIARHFLRRAAAVITPSLAGARAVDPSLASSARLTVVPNGVAQPFFAMVGSNLRDSIGLPATTRLIGMIGRLDPQKGHAVLLRALATLPSDVHVVVIGGALFADALARVRGFAESLRRLADDLGIGGRVHFLGHRDDVASLVHQLDVVAVPSIALESAPRAVAEAQAAERAVVASRIGGIPELITDGVTGLLVPPGDHAALSSALVRLLEDPAARQRLGRNARQVAIDSYGVGAFMRRIEAVCTATIRS